MKLRRHKHQVLSTMQGDWYARRFRLLAPHVGRPPAPASLAALAMAERMHRYRQAEPEARRLTQALFDAWRIKPPAAAQPTSCSPDPQP